MPGPPRRTARGDLRPTRRLPSPADLGYAGAVPGRRVCSGILAASLALGAARAASAEPVSSERDASPRDVAGEEATTEDPRYVHALQVGVRAAVLGGYRMVLRYDDSPFCSEPDFTKSLDDQQQFCGHLGPAMLDLAVSFAPLASIEPFAMVRLGIVGEAPTDTRPLRIVAVGTRVYTRPKMPVKFFVEPSLGVEFESGAGDPIFTYNGAFDPQYDTDVVLRTALGLQFDLAEHVGLYAQVFGMSVGVLRYLHATMEFGAGVQARFP